MTTPNEELINNLTIKAGVMEMGEKIAWGSDTALMRQAAATLQSQAERIAKWERESETHAKAYGLAIVERDNLRHELKTAQEGWRCECSTDDACRFARERDALRAELATIAAADPVAWMVQFSPGSRWVELTKEEFDSDLDGHIVYKKQAFFTRPMPAESKDAERYRWFADIAVNGYFDKAEKAFACCESAESCTKQELDAAIDAAIAKGAK